MTEPLDDLDRLVSELEAARSDGGAVAAGQLDAWLRVVAERGASDLLLLAGEPPALRIDGRVIATEGPPSTVRTSRTWCCRSLPPHAQRAYREHGIADASRRVERRRPVPDQPASRARPRGGGDPRCCRAGASAGQSSICRPAPTCSPGCRAGLVLIGGATGSGKTTTLAAIVDEINRRDAKHIITIEDPIEYEHTNQRSVIQQVEIGIDAPDFPTALRSALRQAPDVIVIGEMRDPETMKIALAAGETGHLVLSTLHTTDVPSTIARMTDSFPAERQPTIRQEIAAALVGGVRADAAAEDRRRARSRGRAARRAVRRAPAHPPQRAASPAPGDHHHAQAGIVHARGMPRAAGQGGTGRSGRGRAPRQPRRGLRAGDGRHLAPGAVSDARRSLSRHPGGRVCRAGSRPSDPRRDGRVTGVPVAVHARPGSRPSAAAHAHARYTTVEFTTDLAINAQGVRDDEPIGPKAPTSAASSCSATRWCCRCRCRCAETFCERLEARLNAARRPVRWRVINGGVQGYGPVQEWFFFDRVGAAFEPDLVLIVAFVGNDAIEAHDYRTLRWTRRPAAEAGQPSPAGSRRRRALERRAAVRAPCAGTSCAAGSDAGRPSGRWPTYLAAPAAGSRERPDGRAPRLRPDRRRARRLVRADGDRAHAGAVSDRRRRLRHGSRRPSGGRRRAGAAMPATDRFARRAGAAGRADARPAARARARSRTAIGSLLSAQRPSDAAGPRRRGRRAVRLPRAASGLAPRPPADGLQLAALRRVLRRRLRALSGAAAPRAERDAARRELLLLRLVGLALPQPARRVDDRRLPRSADTSAGRARAAPAPDGARR